MKKPWKLLAYGVCGLVGIWLTAKVLLPVGLPFLLGYLLSSAAAPAERLPDRGQRTAWAMRWRRGP